MPDSKKIFEVRRQIEKSKLLGYKVIPKTVSTNKHVATIICEKLNVNFFIDYESLEDLRYRWMKSGMSRFIHFYNWLLKDEV